jgi:hypothetical protein
MATTLSTAIVVVYFARTLARVEPGFSPRSLNRTLGRSLLAILPATLAFGLPIWAGVLEGDTLQGLGVLVVVGVAGLSSYYALARRLGVQEVGEIVAFGKASLLRLVSTLRSRA